MPLKELVAACNGLGAFVGDKDTELEAFLFRKSSA